MKEPIISLDSQDHPLCVQIIAVDFSITSPGVAIWDGQRITVFALSEKVKRNIEVQAGEHRALLYPCWNKSKGEEKVERYLAKAHDLATLIKYHVGVYTQPASQVWLAEGMAMQAKGAVLDIAEAFGMFEHALHSQYHNAFFEKVAPSTVKKSFHGKGNAKKDEMVAKAMVDPIIGPLIYGLLEAEPKLKVDGSSPIGDLVDAYALCKMKMFSSTL
jgi:Holliday junction resolvasome RuvABC endonuclease subunit